MKYAFLFLLLFAPIASFADKPTSKALLDINNRNLAETRTETVYSGTPVVKIENTVGVKQKPRFTKPMDAEKYRLFGTLDIVNAPLHDGKEAVIQQQPATPAPQKELVEFYFKTPFHQNVSAVNIPHTSDFMVMVSVLDENTIVIEEKIQNLTTSDKPFERYIPLSNGAIDIINVTHNNQPLNYTLTQDENNYIISSVQNIPAGLNTYSIKYSIKGALTYKNNIAHLNLSLTGDMWDLPIDRFSAIVLRPNTTDIQSKNLVFGANNVAIKGAYDEKTDAKSNTFYHLTHQLPAFGEVKLNEKFTNNLPQISSTEQITPYLSSILWGLCALFILIYLLFSGIYLSYKKEVKLLTKINKMPTDVLLYLTKKKKVSLKTIVYLNYKYVLTSALLILMTGGILYTQKMNINLIDLCFVIIVSILMHIIFYFVSIVKNMRREIDVFKKTLLTTNLGYGLSEKNKNSILTHYAKVAKTLDFYDTWVHVMTKKDEK